MKKIIASSLILLTAGGCAVARLYDAQIISGDANQVAIKAGIGANPGGLAAEHCASFQKVPVLANTSGNLSGMGIDQTRIYTFECRELNWSRNTEKVDKKLAIGQNRDVVRRIAGAPNYVMNAGSSRQYWWYLNVGKKDVHYILRFDNGVLTGATGTSTAEVKAWITQ